ncbi:hypothetical protein I8D64_08045 [Brachybacterium sp. MASK1Z-5]|uniref:DUF1453 domain-containing protein n=1 Tax=Brachybacterium halotolerans TaxID=2795215 RepID=A0ABS1B9L2_9MICO|nr:hypothetical protein [Brachybacterium halotolerans]MBK0331352.1 hypothetical protein [Brachybacterium halotolerans]
MIIGEVLEARGALDGLLAVAFILYSCVQQARWSPVHRGELWRTPAVLAVIGILMLRRSALESVTPQDVVLALLGGLAAFGVGMLTGRITELRPLSREARAALERRRSRGRGRRSTAPLPSQESRAGWWGAALWAVVIGIRLGVEILAEHVGAEAVASAGGILLLVAAAEAGRALLVARALR